MLPYASFFSQLADSRVSSRRDGEFIGLQNPGRTKVCEKKEEADEKEREREEKRFLSRDIGGGHDPCRLFVIVICITMDETWIMGSWDLPSEHDEKEGKRNLLSSVLCNHGTRTLSTGTRSIADRNLCNGIRKKENTQILFT